MLVYNELIKSNEHACDRDKNKDMQEGEIIERK